MRVIGVREIRERVGELCVEANVRLRKDVLDGLKRARRREASPIARQILSDLIENARIARLERLPICQDTGMAVVFLEIGQGVRITGGNLTRAVNEGVADGYKKGFLRKSVVADPLIRKNTGTNTPCIILRI